MTEQRLKQVSQKENNSQDFGGKEDSSNLVIAADRRRRKGCGDSFDVIEKTPPWGVFHSEKNRLYFCFSMVMVVSPSTTYWKEASFLCAAFLAPLMK